MNNLRVVQDPAALSRTAAEEFVRLAAESVRERGRFAVALAGGNTPRAAYEQIASMWEEAPGGPIDWTGVHLFWGDERHVPPDDPQSNFRLAKESLIERVPIPLANVHPIPAANPDAREAASRYEREIREFFELQTNAMPRFDLVLLGMGPDGHIASIFPDTEAVEEATRLVMGNPVKTLHTWRITLTLPVLNAAAHVVILVSGREKAPALRRVLHGPHDPPLLPAERLAPNGTLLWLADREAAGVPPDRAAL